MIYEWREGSRWPLDPQTAGDEIVRIQEKIGRPVAPDDVVEASKGRSSLLHPIIWRLDDKAAAYEYRKQVSRSLIGDLVIKLEGSSVRPAAFYSITYEDTSGNRHRGYVGADEVESVPVFHTQVLEEALAALKGWRSRYKHIQELRDLFELIDQKT